MKLSHAFTPNPMHRYTVPPGVMVQSAKFGAVQVDVWQDEPGPIWRGLPKTVVGYASLGLWRYVVQGKCSGCATSEAAARALGERRAYGPDRPPRGGYAHAYDEAAEAAAFDAYIADIEARFPGLSTC